MESCRFKPQRSYRMGNSFHKRIIMWVTNYSINVTTNNTTMSGDYFTQTTTWDEAFNTKTSTKNGRN